MTDLDVRVIAEGLRFPEGPIAMPDGSVVLVEIARGTLSRVDTATGAISVIAECGGGPNGAALGPDGMIYVANNGGFFEWFETDGIMIPGPTPTSWTGGSIQRIDPATGSVDTLYDSCDGAPLVAPNDLVFDQHGGIWFTDHGVQHGNYADQPGLLYAQADGSSITSVVVGLDAANGIGLSPAGDRVYAAETHTGKVWQWQVTSPGSVAPVPDAATDENDHRGGHLLFDAPDGSLFDSLAVDGDGWVCVATIGAGGITTIAPDGSQSDHISMPDPLVTNICFGASDPAASDGGSGDAGGDMRTAFVTCSSSGKLVSARWPRPGLRLAHH